jgi:hypothetical protein
MTKTVVLTDEQSLQDNPRGVIGVISSEDTYRSDAGFEYKVSGIGFHHVPNTRLALVEKKLGDESELYVCYIPVDVTHGSRADNSYLFADDDNFNAAIYADNKEFAGTLHASVEANEKNPAFAVEYRCVEDDDNPAIFVFETINPDTEASHVELYRGYLVRKEEVSVC